MTGSAGDRPAPRLERIGSGSAVVTLAAATGNVDRVRDMAAALAPFPRAGDFYPGVRRPLGERDGEAWDYARALVEVAGPYVAGAYECDSFELVEASFSIVTDPPESLAPPQRTPHFDSTDPDLIAMVHYLADVPGSGTAFFRHEASGIDRLSESNVDAYVTMARREALAASGYVQGSNAHYEELYRVDALADRLLIYPASLLHSGIIPPGMILDADPRKGRLTGNYFLRLNR